MRVGQGEDANQEEPSFDTSNFHKHLERQSKILRAAIASSTTAVTDDVANPGRILEEWIFKPRERPKNTPGESYVDNEPKFNFFPPFLTPECIALHYPFFTTMPIPMSCKANCVGTVEYHNWKNSHRLPDKFPTDFEKWDDGIGSLDIISDLKENQKFVLLKADNGRLRWFKAKAEGMKFWCYPIISVPPSIGKLVMETLMCCAENAESDKVHVSKKLATQISSIGITLNILEKLMKQKWFIRNAQESLHYCFGHGFVKLVKMLTETDLSNYVTFHGLTYRNRLNNSGLHAAIDDGDDKMDYITDSIYLFLILTWQTAMDVWQQAIDEAYIDAVKTAIVVDATEPLLNGNYEEACRIVTNIVTGGDVLFNALENSLPDFINQSQLTNFRTFVATRSGVPQSICPILPSDCVPISYVRAPPVLWPHVFILNMASFLCNQGDYMKAIPDESLISSCLCDCNLCSPHKMPCYNTHLQDEILTLDKLSLSDGQKTATVGVEEFCNSLIRLTNDTDFFHDSITFYKDNQDMFSPVKPSVVRNTKLLSILKELKAKKEAELLKRGQGIYLNPTTGERISRSSTIVDDGRSAAGADCRGRDRRSEMLPSTKDGPSQSSGGKRM